MPQALWHLPWWIEQLLHHNSISLVFHFLYICYSSSSIHLFIDESVWTKMASDFLKAGTLVRCLYKLEFTSSDRSLRFTKDWAGSHLDIVCSALGYIIEGDTSVFEKQLLIIQMRQKHVYICVDIFRKRSSQTLYRRSSDTIAIYEVVWDENGYCLSRNKSLDARVRTEYIRLQELDKGDLPYFYDTMNPSVYENGRLIEDFRYKDIKDEDPETRPSVTSLISSRRDPDASNFPSWRA